MTLPKIAGSTLHRLSVLLVTLGCMMVGTGTVPAGELPNRFFGIHVVDESTGRGVPLVELSTVHQVRHVTDSAGWVALDDPGLMGRRVFFHVRSHGYGFPEDGFGYAGTVLTPTAGAKTILPIKRTNIAERLYRITGEGIYRDSLLLGEEVAAASDRGQVAGQDSAFAVPYRGQIRWFWGDTSRLSYPLGHFWMAGATSLLPADGGLDPSIGVSLDYFVDPDGFSRPMARLGVASGPIWIDAVCALPDETGRERLVCHYAHMESLAKMLDHGLAIYNDKTDQFETLQPLPMNARWAFPGQAHPIRVRTANTEYLYLGEVFPTVRVPATLTAFCTPQRYEAWTCLAEGSTPSVPVLQRSPDGHLQYAWRRNTQPVDIPMEWDWITRGRIRPEEAGLVPVDVSSGKPIRLHRGSVAWNRHRKRWIMIACEQGGTSALGEVWYAEASEPTGPWRRARKILSHDRYSFYNPVHHPFFDQEGGRILYFEGTYTTAFSGNPEATPRYDYNQIMHRLDLDDPRLKPAQE